MTNARQDRRRREIEAAAFLLLAETGYRSTSMLQVARRAGASNQTLYAWYGSKQGLFRSLIEANGRAAKEVLREALDGVRAPLDALRALGPVLLGFTTGAEAIVINRAAVADAAETGLLGAAIDAAARSEIVALTGAVMQRLVATGVFRPGTDPAEAAEVHLSLLLGEVQMRQAMGRLGPLDAAAIAARAERAFALTFRLYAAG
jgi:AcrR family transcriptional regulator